MQELWSTACVLHMGSWESTSRNDYSHMQGQLHLESLSKTPNFREVGIK